MHEVVMMQGLGWEISPTEQVWWIIVELNVDPWTGLFDEHVRIRYVGDI